MRKNTAFWVTIAFLRPWDRVTGQRPEFNRRDVRVGRNAEFCKPGSQHGMPQANANISYSPGEKGKTSSAKRKSFWAV